MSRKQVFRVLIQDCPDPRGGSRSGAWSFTNERAANGFRRRLYRALGVTENSAEESEVYVSIEPIDVYGSSLDPSRMNDTWPFEELIW